MDLFKLLGTITINNSDANEALEETGQAAEKTKGRLSSAFSAVGKGAVAVGKTIGTGLLAGGAAMGALTVKAMNLSGELEQNMGGSEQVFKEYAGKMQETARSAFENMGLSTSDFLGTANKMGALFQGAGFSIEESSNLASDAMQRAADVASIMGIDTSAAMEAIAGAAKGNFTMMDNLGVAMNDTTLNAYALEKGIDKTTQQMTNQEKIALAMEMFMEKTSYAAGNYARENQTLAGSLGTAKAALTNFLDGSGDVDSLVSAFSNAADVIVKNLGEIAPRLISGITEIINKIIPMLSPLLQQLLPVIVEGAVSLINGLVSAFPSIVSALMDALPALIKGVQKIINGLLSALPSLVQTLVSALPTLIPMVVDALVSMIVMLCEMLPQIIQPIIDYLPEIIISLVNALMNNLPALIEGLIMLVGAIIEALPQILAALFEACGVILSELLAPIGELFTKLWQDIYNALKSAWDWCVNLLSTVGTWIYTNVIAPVANFFKGLWSGIVSAFHAVIDPWIEIIKRASKIVYDSIIKPILDYFKGLWESIKTVFSVVGTWFNDNIVQPVKNVFDGIWNGLKNGAQNAWDGIKNIFGSVASFFGDIFGAAWGKVKEVFSVGGKIFDGIKEGIVNTFKMVVNGIIKGINKIVKMPFEGLNKILETIYNIDILGVKPFTWLTWRAPIPQIPELAEGTVVDEPTPAIFGEDGAEAVVPLENNTGWLNKVASNLHELMVNEGDINNGVSTRLAELQQVQVSELRILNSTVNKIFAAILALDENMGGNLRDALDGVAFNVNNREFARLVKESI